MQRLSIRQYYRYQCRCCQFQYQYQCQYNIGECNVFYRYADVKNMADTDINIGASLDFICMCLIYLLDDYYGYVRIHNKLYVTGSAKTLHVSLQILTHF